MNLSFANGITLPMTGERQRVSRTIVQSRAKDDLCNKALCSREEAQREAQEHFDRAGEALIEALGHSAAAGVTIECPPLAIYEGYQVVEAWKEAAQEYNAGCEARDRGGN